MERGKRERNIDECFSNYKLERHLSFIQIHGNMKQRSAIEIWRWIASIVKKINGFIKFFKCDNVSVVNICRVARSHCRLEQRSRPRKRRYDRHSQHTESDPSCDDRKTSSTTSICKSQCKTWVKRLILRGRKGRRTKKRGIASDRDGRRSRLTRKRKRIGISSSVIQHRSCDKDDKDDGLHAFLRQDERCPLARDSTMNPAKRKSDSRASSPRVSETHSADCSSDGNRDGEEGDLRYLPRSRLHVQGRVQPPDHERDSPAPMQPLPDELVDKVLGRLPLTSVLRFRSVCRRWRSRLSPDGWSKIIQPRPPRQGLSSASSASASGPTSASSSHPSTAWTACPALFSSGNGRRQCAFYDFSLQKWSRILLDFLPESACHLLAASGGLLCLCYSGLNSSLFVCNPLTRSWRMLPSFNHTRRRAGSMIVHMLVHQETGAYKVIVIGHPTCMTAATPGLTEVFDSETGLWTALADVPSDGCRLAPSMILRNGVMYCLTELPTGLLAFNLERKVWRRLEIKSQFRRVVAMFEHRGQIMLVAKMSSKASPRLGIWRLRESFPRVWLKVAIMPADHAAYFLRSGRFQCFGHGSLICFASPRREQWLMFDLGKGTWTWGAPARGLDKDGYNRWFFYEPSFEIQA